jgi:ABC-type branched-subunit amino acid transport system substrate-binding protein
MHAPYPTDIRGWVDALSQAETDAVILYTYVKPAADLLRTALHQGWRTHWLGCYVLSGPELFLLAEAEAVEGMTVTGYPMGPRDPRAEALYQRLLARYDGGETAGAHSRIGYAAAQLVTEGLRRVGPILTREGFISALETIHDWTGGLLPPISYNASDHSGLTCLAIYRARRGRWLLVHGHVTMPH